MKPSVWYGCLLSSFVLVYRTSTQDHIIHYNYPVIPKLYKYSGYSLLYNNQINAHSLIGQSAMGYCAGKQAFS